VSPSSRGGAGAGRPRSRRRRCCPARKGSSHGAAPPRAGGCRARPRRSPRPPPRPRVPSARARWRGRRRWPPSRGCACHHSSGFPSYAAQTVYTSHNKYANRLNHHRCSGNPRARRTRQKLADCGAAWKVVRRGRKIERGESA
jgi:hypothetical protein